MHMGSGSERYCVNGEHCKLYDQETGRPQRLSRDHKGDIRNRCTRAMVDEDLEFHQRTPSVIYEPVRHKANPRRARLEAAKRNLVAQLLARRGDFWEVIKYVRSRWQLDPVPTQLPPTPRTYSTLGRRRPNNRPGPWRSSCRRTARKLML